jgi:hypothetical protein
MGFGDEEKILEQLGLQIETPEQGCCGMAGSFGFEPRDHYEVSMACGERKLLPAVRAADDETLIIADGFSCREQIAQSTNRRAVHLAQVLAAGNRQDGSALVQATRRAQPRLDERMLATALAAAGITLAAGAAIWLLKEAPTKRIRP